MPAVAISTTCIINTDLMESANIESDGQTIRIQFPGYRVERIWFNSPASAIEAFQKLLPKQSKYQPDTVL